jgi:Skp family chaperone for outer membrane proteins
MAIGSVAQLNAQQFSIINSQILIIDSDQLFTQSQFGQRVAKELDEQGRLLATENRRIEAELAQEEKDLTAERATLEADAFRVLADVFDQKVQETRARQLAKTQVLNTQIETQRVTFLNAAAPILQDLMRQAGASALFERRSVVLSTAEVDITRAAIEKINDVLGDGSQPATSGD